MRGFADKRVVVVVLFAVAGTLLLSGIFADNENPTVDVANDATLENVEATDDETAFNSRSITFNGAEPVVDNSLFYGNPMIMRSLADTEVGGPRNRRVAYRFKLPTTKKLVAVRNFIVFRTNQPGGPSLYHDGDGSTLQYSVETDDNTPAHNPSGEKLVSSPHIFGGPPLSRNQPTVGLYEGAAPPTGAPGAIYGCDLDDDTNFRKVCFDEPLTIEADTYYHITAENTGSQPETNFVSLNSVFHNGPNSDRDELTPRFDDLFLSIAYQDDGGEWINRDTHTAIIELIFDDGTSWGNSYMEISPTPNSPGSRASKWLDQTQKVRQIFTPSSDITINSINVAALHVSGENTAQIKLLDSGGDELYSGQLESFPNGDHTGQEIFTNSRFRGIEIDPLQLRGGMEYSLEIQSNGRHAIGGLRDGSITYDFSPQTSVVGQAEYAPISSQDWRAWELRSEADQSGQFDLSFFFDLDL